MTEHQSGYVTGDGSGVALPEVVDDVYPAIVVTSNAPTRDAGIRALFEEVLADLATRHDVYSSVWGCDVLEMRRDLRAERQAYQRRINALLCPDRDQVLADVVEEMTATIRDYGPLWGGWEQAVLRWRNRLALLAARG